MSKSAPSTSAISPLFRLVAVVVLFLSITACGLQILSVMAGIDHPDPNATPTPVATLFATPLLTLIGGIALSTLLEGVARLVGAQTPVHEDASASMVNVILAIGELQNSLPAILTDAMQQAIPPTPPAPPESPVEISHLSPIDPGIEQQLQRIVIMMEEMKSTNPPAQGLAKGRRPPGNKRQHSARLKEVDQLIQSGKWEQADALLNLLESLRPGDSEVLARRNQLDDARIQHQADGWDQLKPQVDGLLARSKYAEALEVTSPFLDRFPNHQDCRQLHEQIKRDQQAYIEKKSNQLYEELKSSVETRQWRKALDCIQQFLHSYPDHPRATKIRQQVRVVQKNAEIEERHEQEERIRELITSKRYADAADLSEDLLQRFPDSPQAAYLTELLPKLRERAMATEPEDIIT